MLQRLSIQNHALIERIDMRLGPGFHAFTGETGSGKSILLGAIGLLLGNRAETNAIGLNGDRTIVEGDFMAPHLERWLEEEDLPATPNIRVRREVLRNGRSRVFINDAQATVGQLRAMGSELVDLLEQNGLGAALEPWKVAELLDKLAPQPNALQDYTQALNTWTEAKKRCKELEEIAQDPRGDVGYLEHQIQELDSLGLQAMDWSEFQADLLKLSHAAELTQAIRSALDFLANEDQGMLGQLEGVRKLLTKVASLDADLDEIVQRLESVNIELQDIEDTLDQTLEERAPDPSRLAQMERQHDNVQRAMKRHAVQDPNELLAIGQQLSSQVEELGQLDERWAMARKAETEAFEALKKAGEGLFSERMNASKGLASDLLPWLAQLKMPHASVEWRFESIAPQPWGMHQPVLWFSSNPGMAMLPLEKVASGGERARFMLALKAVLAQVHSAPVVVFDEIDTGVSGEVAFHMGAAMHDIANSGHTGQILAVTHLPQVASKAKHQWAVQKHTEGASTFVTVEALDDKGRQQAIASMLSAEAVTPEALSQASHLLGHGKD